MPINIYQIAPSSVGNCSGEIAGELTCQFPVNQINNVRVNLSVSGTTYTCSFTGGTTAQKVPYFTGDCSQQVGTVLVSNTPWAQKNKPIIVHLP